MSGFDWTLFISNTWPAALLLILGVTLFLAAGCAVMWLTRSPVHRQRWGELTLIGACIWCLLALIPLPRLFHALQIAPKQGVASNQTDTRTQLQPQASGTDFDTSPMSEEDSELLMTADVDTLSELDVRNQLQELLRTSAGTPQDDSQRQAVADLVPAIKADSRVEIPRAVEVGPLSVEATTAEAASELPFPPPATPWGVWLLGTYLAGAVACAAWLLIGQVLLSRIRRQRLDIEPWLVELFEQVVPRDTDRRLRLIVSARCGRALSWGVWRPVIVLPVSLCRRGNECQIRTVLLHELGHVAQRDAWSNLLISLSLPVLYLHPLFWWMRVQMRLSAELLADDWAAQQTGKTQYVEELVALAKVTTGRGILLPGVTGLFSSPSQFYRRMNMLLTREEPLVTRPTWTWRCLSLGLWGATVVAAVALAGVGPAVGQQEVPTDPAPTVQVVPADAKPPAEAVADPAPVVPAAPVVQVEAPKPAAPVTVNPSGVVVTPTPEKPADPAGRAEIRLAAPPLVSVRAVPPNSEEATKLLAELQRIQERLRALGHEIPVPAVANWPSNGKTITTSQVDAKGQVIQETWTVDEKGNRQKLVVRVNTGRMEDGKLVPYTATVNREGLISIQNPNTALPPGKVIVTRQGVSVVEAAVDPTPSASAPVTAPVNVPVPPLPTITVQPGFNPVAVDGRSAVGEGIAVTVPPTAVRTTAKPGYDPSAGARQELDLVTLATSYSDAVGVVESAKALLEAIEPQAKEGTIGVREVVTARVGLKNAERKEKLLRRIVASALKRAELELEFVSSNHKKGYVSTGRLNDAQGHVDVLKEILNSSDSNPPATDPNRN